MQRLLCLLLLLFPTSLRAQINDFDETINSVTISSGAFVIDSDSSRGGGSYDRHLIKVYSTVSYTRTAGTGGVNYRYDYQLLDENGTLVNLDNGAGGTTTVQGTPFSISANVGRISTESIRPAQTLDPSKSYRARLLVKQQLVTGGIYTTQTQGDTAGQKLIHFTSTASNDAAVNVRAVVNSVSWSRKFACDTDPANVAFQAEADITLYRYDRYLAAIPGSAAVPFRYVYQLREAGTGTVVAIASSQTTPSHTLDEYVVSGGIETPDELAVTPTFTVNPNSQIASVTKQYYVTVEAAHEEQTGQPYVTDDAATDSPERTLLHFNGTFTDTAGTDSVIVTSITNNPAAAGFTVLPGHITATADIAAGFVVGKPDYTFTGSGAYSVKLFDDGHAELTTASDLTVIAPTPVDFGTVNGIRFLRDDIVFDMNGFSSLVAVVLPAGLGAHLSSPVSEAPLRTLESLIAGTASRALDQSLQPIASSMSFSIPAADFGAGRVWYLVEETKPVEISAQSIVWDIANGEIEPGPPVAGVNRVRYVRQLEVAMMPLLPIPVADQQLKSNELYYQYLTGTTGAGTPVFTAGVLGSAKFNGTLDLDPGKITCHFPLDAVVKWNNPGVMEIANDLVVPATSSLGVPDPVTLPWARDCEEFADCGAIGEATASLDPGGAPVGFTRDGGLGVEGTMLSTGARRDVVTGYIASMSGTTPTYAHNTDAFTKGRFLMAGHFIAGPDFLTARNEGPGRLLNTGYNPADLNDPDRPGAADYTGGPGDYPGINYRVAAETAAINAVSVLGGMTTPSYQLGSRAKYYVRKGGVTGIHEPTSNPFPGPVTIYGYPFTFTSFGLSFLDSEVLDSITAGSLVIPDPSDFTLAFDKLYFNCIGGLTNAEISGGSLTEDLDFWHADFTAIAASFEPAIGAACDPSDAYLTLGVQAWASNISTPLAGVLGFKPDGNLITAADGLLEDVDSRLNLPSVIYLDGPTGEADYAFFPAHDAYYDNHDHSSESVGRLNFAGFLDVPFFEDLEVHFQTGAAQGNTTDPIYMAGGWVRGGETFFSTDEFDLDHYGRPPSDTVANYRAGANPDYLVHARQDWIGVVPFDYELVWNDTTRSFRNLAPSSTDLLVLQTESELTYLSSENAELDFGLNIALDTPEINLSNLATTGIIGSFTVSFTESATSLVADTVTNALLDGLDRSAELLNDRMDTFYDRIFDATVDPLVDNLYTALDPISDNYTAMEAEVTARMCTNVDSVSATLKDIAGTAGSAGSVIDEVDQALARVQAAIRMVIGRVRVDSAGEIVLDPGTISVPEEVVSAAGETIVEGIFADADGDGYDIAEVMLVALIEELSPDIAASLSGALSAVAGSLADKLDDQLNTLFADAKPTIEMVKQALMEIHNAISEVRSNGDFYSEIADIVADSATAIDDLMNDAKDEVLEFLSTINFDEYTADEIKQVIRDAIRDKFNASPVIAAVQEVLKSYVYDLDAAMREALSSAFGQLNTLINDLLEDVLPLDSTLSSLLGDVASISAAGSIDGYAHINGDALRTLRLDASIQLKLPDDFEFNGFFEINQLDSFGDDSCSFAGEGEYAAEVKMGATDVGAAWIGDGLRFDVDCKFTFDTASGFALRGFGGSFQMTEGEIGFESMAITSLGAAAMFGLDENYLAAEVGLRFDSYELAGGVFFGRTCTVDPLLLVDPDVVNVLGDPPFTGIYAYGEAQIPIINFSCLFNLSAKAGMGVFWFEEGNTYGGKAVLGASGEALCAVNVGGDITLIGSKSGNDYSFFGKGHVFGEIGKSPFSVSFDESVSITYKNNEWTYDY